MVVLLVAGLAYNAVLADWPSWSELRFTGPLQVYAVLVLVVGRPHRVVRRPAVWATLTVAVGGAYLFLLVRWRASCPGGELVETCNPSGPVESFMFGASHLHHAGGRGHDPARMVVLLGALVTALAGVTAGHLLLGMRHRAHRAVAALVGWTVTLAAAGWMAHLVVPAFKRLWTPGFGLGVAAVGVLALTLGFFVFDVPAAAWVSRVRERIAWPLVAMGRNSLLVYFGSHLLVFDLITRGGLPRRPSRRALRCPSPGVRS